MIDPKIIFCNEPRIYMGSKGGPIPRGATVRLFAKVFAGKGYWWRMGFFEWNGEKLFAPIRVLWRVRR